MDMAASGSERGPSPRKRKYEDEITQSEILEIHRLLSESKSDDFDEPSKDDESKNIEVLEDDPFAEEIVMDDDVQIEKVVEEEEDPFAEEFDFPYYDDDYLIQLAQPEKKNPMFIPELIQEVFSYLDTSILKTCRMVCLSWDENASHMLLKESKLQIIVKYRDKIRPYPKLKNASYKVVDLRNYMSRSTGGTPTLSFHLNTNYFHESEVQAWLNDFGENITGLYIECHLPLHHDCPFMIEQLRHLFKDQTPNLQELTFELSNSAYLPSAESITAKRAKLKLLEFDRRAPILSNLKKLTIKNVKPSTKHINIEVIQDFMLSANNLQDVQFLSSNGQCLNTEFADSFIATRISAVKKVVVAPRVLTMFSLIRFSEAHPYNLQSLTINVNEIIFHAQKYDDITKVLNNIFTACRFSLRSLNMEPLSFFPGLMIPSLPNVSNLCLTGTRKPEVVSILPPSTRHHHHEMYNIFPNLRKLTFCANLGGILLDNCLTSFTSSTTAKFPLMTDLTVLTWPDGDGSESALQHLSNLFPNLQKLVIRPSATRFDLPVFIRHIVKKFPRLKFLKLQNFELNYTGKRDFTKASLEIDSALTGISVNTMKTKKRQLTKVMKDLLEDLERWSSEPSLDNLVELASFELELSVGRWSQFRKFSTRNSHPLLSMSLRALKRIPTIKVILTGDLEENELGCQSAGQFNNAIKDELASFLGDAQSIVEINLRRFFGLMTSDSDEEDDEDYDEDYDDELLYLYNPMFYYMAYF